MTDSYGSAMSPTRHHGTRGRTPAPSGGRDARTAGTPAPVVATAGVEPPPVADVPGTFPAHALDVGALRMVQAVAEHGTLTAAAAALGVSQPAVSQHLRRLERRLGTAVLDRSGRSVRLTEAGRVLARHGATVSAALHAASAEVAALTGLRAGVVRLVAFPSACATLVPRALADLRVRHPGLSVTLVEAEPPESVALLAAGEADVVLTFAYDDLARTARGPDDVERPTDDVATAAPDPRLVHRRLLTDPTLVALPAGHPAATADGLALGDLAADTWIAGCPRCRRHLLTSGRAAGFEPRVAYATDDYPAVLGLVAAGLGVAVLPGLVRATAAGVPGVVLRPVDGTSARRVDAVTTRDLLRVPAVVATLDALASAAAPA
jgi:DNA-binding transcriptional LysR family regulator